MAIHKSDIIKAKDSLDVSSKNMSGEKTGARVLYATAEYVFKPTPSSPTEQSGDVIELADIPAGATVVPHLSWVGKSFGYKYLTVALGDADDNFRHGLVSTYTGDAYGYLNHSKPSFSSFGNAAKPMKPYEKETRVLASISDLDSTIAANSKLTFGIAYRVQG